MHDIDLLHIRIFFLFSQLISKIDIFWSTVDDFTVFLLLQNSSDFEICSLMRDNEIMLNNNFFSVYKSSCMCRIPTQTNCKILLSMCMAMCMCISCNIYVALRARGLKAKIDFLINALKFEILFITNISLALLGNKDLTTCDIHYCMQHESQKM